MKKLYSAPDMELLLFVSDLLLASDGDELDKDDYEEGLPGWNGSEIVLPPMPLPSN
jgi:hypothetical protein